MNAPKEKAARAKSGSLRGETRRLTTLAQIVKVLDLIKLEFLRRAHWTGDPTAKAKITEILNQWIRGQAGSHQVTIEKKGAIAAIKQAPFNGHRQCRLARSAQPSKPNDHPVT
jgi:hypothetical protein